MSVHAGIIGSYESHGKSYPLPRMRAIVENESAAELWAREEASYLSARFGWTVTQLELVDYNPTTGTERVIERII